ncbi:hypothetical protein [Streptomyces sp. BA2]|uniref:hypothetical protein n=1 Tax=Streptomyces sp. BA2 TaxID=436595 RepID=UPI003FA7A607
MLTRWQRHAEVHHRAVRPARVTGRRADPGRRRHPLAPATPATGHGFRPGCGFGLIGMRERAHSAGGHPYAGHRPDAGFEVTAHLPPHPENTEEKRTT